MGLKIFAGDKTYRDTSMVMNHNFLDFVNPDKKNECNINLQGDYFQTRESAPLIREWCNKSVQKDNIINNNPFKKRYNNNNDVFIHVRLDDARQFAPSFEYFDTILGKLEFDVGYISSDTIRDPLCEKLITKYNLIPLNLDEIKTIQFGSTCKTIILSNGTFSWMLGVLAFFSKIYNPIRKREWHGDIFVFPDWTSCKW